MIFKFFFGLVFLVFLGLRAFEVVRVLNFEGFGLLAAARIIICSIGSLSRTPTAAI